MYIIKQIYEIDKKLIDDWNELWNKCDNRNYFNSYTWFKNYIDAFEIKKFVIMMGYLNEELKFILPLILKKKTYATIGGKYLDNVSFLFNENPDVCITELKKYAIINRISIILNECNFIIKSQPRIYIEKSSDNPYIKLAEDIKNIIKSKERRYIENLIKKNKELSFKVFSKEECNKTINIVFDIELKSNKIEKNKALFNIYQAKELFKRLANTDFCIIGILYYNSIPIAHMVGINNCGKEFMAYHMAYDKSYKHLQPGKIVIYNLINYLKEKKFVIFDFSRGNSVLKRHFSNYSRSKYNIYLNPSIFIKFKILYKKIKIKLKNIIKKILKEMGLWKK